MSPIIYVSSALRFARAEPRGASLPLRASPSGRARTSGHIPDGTRLVILREQNGWCEVYAHGGHGWAPKTDIVLFY